MNTADPHRTFPTPVEVLGFNGEEAHVIIVGWNLTRPVTVPAELLTRATSRTRQELTGSFLEASVNCYATAPEDLTLTDITLAPDLPDSFLH